MTTINDVPKTQAGWNLYRHDGLFAPDEPRTNCLIVQTLSDGWYAVYRREHKTRVRGTYHGYPNSFIGLAHRRIDEEELRRVGDRMKGEPRAEYDARVKATLVLVSSADPGAPSPESCIASPYIKP